MEIDGLQICLVPLIGKTRIEPVDCMGVSDVKNGNGSGEGEVTISQNWKISTNAGKINRIKGFISVFFSPDWEFISGLFWKNIHKFLGKGQAFASTLWLAGRLCCR
jgi:hypothetical protein